MTDHHPRGAANSPCRVLSAVLLSLGPACAQAAPAAAAEDGERPNILWITCEDISPHLHCFGEGHAVTPHLDRLASQGVRYTHAFSICGVCAPSRSCLITGMYPTSIGSHHMRSRAVLPESIRCFTEHLRDAGYYCTNNVKTDYNFEHPPTAWDESSRTAHWRNRKPGQQFFSVFNFTTTHESRVRAADDEFARLTSELSPDERQNPESLELPPYYPDTPVTRRDWTRYFELITAMDRQAGALLSELEADGLEDNTVVFYFSDHGAGLPRAKRWLYDSGTRVPMIVRWPGVLPPNASEDRLVSFVDFAPTVLSIAGVPIPESMQGSAFLGSKAAPPRQYIYGARDRMDERYDLIRAVRDKRFKYIRNYEPWKPYAQNLDYAEQNPTMRELRRLAAGSSLSGAAALWMRPRKPVEELYILDDDPHEIDNVAGRPEYQDDLQRLRAAHLDWVKETIDVGYLPEPELLRRAGTDGIYAVARREKERAALDRLQTVALRVSEGSADVNELLAFSVDADPAVRYWGVVGLGHTAGTDDERTRASLVSALDDPSPSVRVAAAELLFAATQEQRPLSVLVDVLRHGDPSSRLMAALALDQAGEASRPALEAIKAARDDENQYVVRVVQHAIRELLDRSPPAAPVP